MCYFADQYDDEAIENFGGIELHEAEIQKVSNANKATAWKNLQSLISYSQDTIEMLEKERKNNIVWDTLSTTYKIIDTAFSPQWTTKLELERQVGKLYSRTESWNNIIHDWKEYLKTLQNMPEEKFTKDLYGVNIFFPNKKVMSNEQMAWYIGGGYSDAYNLLKSWDNEAAYLMLTHVLYNALYYHMMSKGMEKTIRKVLKKHSNMKISTGNLNIMFWDVAEIVNLQSIERNISGFWGIIIAIIFFILGAVFNG